MGDGETANTASNGPAPVAVYLYAGDQIIENVTTGYFYYQDSLGNTSHVTDAVGNLLERYTYDAFGTPTFYNAAGAIIYNAAGISQSALGVRHLFQGQLWTQETGLNDYRNRVELPTMGVFLQPDPIGFKGDPANIYRFCNNNAVNRIDPLGLEAHIWLQRDDYYVPHDTSASTAARLAPGTYSIVDNGKVLYRTRANEGPFGKGSMGVKAGDYDLRPKGGLWGPIAPGEFTADQPAITGKAPGLKPGQPNQSYKKPALVHKLGVSTACVTVCDEAVTKTKQLMMRDIKNGETTQMHIRDGTQLRKQEQAEGGGPQAGGTAGGNSSGPTAKDIDLGHQATGVPSLGAEAVNQVNGKL
jgi:RHS repeat-associated protein